MSDEASGIASRWPLLLGVLGLVGVGLWWLLADAPAPPAREALPAADEAQAPPADEPEGDGEPVEAPRDFDRERLARMLLDGSTADQAEEAAALEPPAAPTRGVEEPEEVAAERMQARAAESPATARPNEPPTPAQQLRQATFWRGLLEQRVNAMREAAEAAEARGDAAAARRARRLLERLEAQRPAVNDQIERLQEQVGDDAE